MSAFVVGIWHKPESEKDERIEPCEALFPPPFEVEMGPENLSIFRYAHVI